MRYAEERRQFPGPDGKETVLLDYGMHQRRLIPLLAQTIAMDFASDKLLNVFDEVFSGRHSSDENRQELETLAAALKPLSTWAALDTLQEVREACGGAGFMAKNRVAGLRADLDIYVTFEGDNHVLLQLVGKRLLTDYAAQFKGGDRSALAKAAAEQVRDRLGRFGLRQFAQDVVDLGQAARSIESLRESDAQRALLEDRVHTMISEIAMALNQARKNNTEFETLQANQAKLIEAARAHAELLQWEAFTEALPKFSGETLTVMTWLRDLFAFNLFEKHAAWYLVHGRMSSQRVESVTAYADRLIQRLRRQALDIVDAFGYDDSILRAEIATGIEAERQQEAADYIAAQKAAGTWPIHEKELRKKRQ